jgi:hypothetical protein
MLDLICDIAVDTQSGMIWPRWTGKCQQRALSGPNDPIVCVASSGTADNLRGIFVSTCRPGWPAPAASADYLPRRSAASMVMPWPFRSALALSTCFA